jgi:hypothetical protein
MKFKILKGTETYAKLDALWKQITDSRKAVNKLLDELGTHEFIDGNGIAGGLGAVAFRDKPEGWVRSGYGPGLYYPSAKNRAMRERIAGLPVVPHSALNDIVGFKPSTSFDGDRGRMVRHRSPGFGPAEGCFTMTVSSTAKYTPPNADIIEILESEYQRLMEAADKPAKRKRSKA